jgi:hypothetical protein
MQQYHIYGPIDTNIVFIELLPCPLYCDFLSSLFPSSNQQEFNSELLVEKMKEKGILVSAWAPNLIRVVFHRDISYNDMERIIQCFRVFSGENLGT